MKIIVSTIMKDEPVEFIERWADSAMDADELVLSDTGTTQTDAITCARDLGITVHEIRIDPWRFDDARNANLALLPDCDVVVTLDCDEVLATGWRDALENAGPAKRYRYHYQWNDDIWFLADRTHSREGWRWKHPVHESLTWAGLGPEQVPVETMMRIEHYSDNSKPRSQYLPLLQLAVEEAPNDDRMAHYYARELYFTGQWAESRLQFLRHLALPSATWPAERAQSYRYLAKMDDYPERWLLKAAAEDPSRREAWAELAVHWQSEDPVIAAGFALRALKVPASTGDYMAEAWAGDELMSAIAGV